MKIVNCVTYFVITLCFVSPVAASSGWVDIDSAPPSLSSRVAGEGINIKTKKARYLRGDTASIRTQLLADKPFVDLLIPLPDGAMATYRLQQDPIAEPAFMSTHPELRTFRGVDINNAANSGYFDISPKGLRAMFRHGDVTALIDPDGQIGADRYIVYYQKDAVSSVAGMEEVMTKSESSGNHSFAPHLLARSGSSDTSLRTYRLALAATGEYTQYHGGVSATRAEMLTVVNRLNAIYQRDLGIRFQLVAATDSLIYTDADTDPYVKLSSPLNIDAVIRLAQDNVDNLNAVIGVDSYDIGHLLDRNNDADGIGIAGIIGQESDGFGVVGSVCSADDKGRGVSSLRIPEGDVFYVTLLAHEIGHQFGADHSFAGVDGACFFARSSQHAYEVNSGSSIMGYAGLCESENLQVEADAYFHAHSIEEISTFVQSAVGCGQVSPLLNVNTLLANNVPTVDAGLDYTIPANTAFTLTGSASDADAGDVLNYSWEQFDRGVASSIGLVDDGSGPIFRSFEPVLVPFRTFPRFADVLNNERGLGEVYPATTRELNFRLTVRDGSGGTAFDETVVNVENTGQAFAVTAPAQGDFWLSSVPATVEWNVADTNVSPINCAAVDIMLSTGDAGVGSNAFSVMLASAVANDGRETVTVPSVDTAEARLMIKCTDNVFFALNSGAFELVQTELTATAVEGSQSVIEGEDIVLTVVLATASSAVNRLPLVLTNINTDAADYGSAAFSNGVTLANGVLTIPAGVSRFSLILSTVDDDRFEADEVLNITVGDTSARATITNNDVMPESPSSGGGGGGGGSLGFVEFISLLLATLFLGYAKSRRRLKGN